MAKNATSSKPAKASAKASAAVKPAPKPIAKAKSAEAPPSPAKPAKSTLITTKQLAGQLAETHDLPAKQAQAVLDGVVGLLVDHLKAGDALRLNGLGVLEVKDRPARTGRNPATGATIQIAAGKKIAFRPAKELKDAI
ncbi:MAG: HU family DNA-binding protein [Janthinobacterium lividum]